MFVDVKDENGKIVNWAIEMNSPGVLARAGWTKRMFKYGDQITITIRPAKAGTPVGLLNRQKPVIVNGKEVLKADEQQTPSIKRTLRCEIPFLPPLARSFFRIRYRRRHHLTLTTSLEPGQVESRSDNEQ